MASPRAPHTRYGNRQARLSQLSAADRLAIEHRTNGHTDSSGEEHQTAECPMCVEQAYPH
jgi:hypothetical protein